MPEETTIDPEVAAFEKRVAEAVDTKIEAKLAELRADYDRQLKALATKRGAVGLPGYEPQASDDPSKCFSLNRAVLGHLDGWGERTKGFHEYEIVNEYRSHMLSSGHLSAIQKDGQVAGFGDKGGLLISASFMPGYLPALESNAVAAAAGVPVMNGITGGPLSLNRDEGGCVAYWPGERKAITSSDNDTSMLELRPHKMGILTYVSRELLVQTSGTARTWTQDNMARKGGRELDLQFFLGDGVSKPTGILQAPSIGTTGFGSFASSGASQTAKALLTAMETGLKTRDAYYGYGAPTYFGHPNGFAQFREAIDANGQEIKFFTATAANTAAGGVATDLFHGHRYAETTHLTGSGANSHLILFPVEAALIAVWDAMSIMVSEHAQGAFAEGDLAVRAIMLVDSNILRGEFVQSATSWTIS